MIVPLTKQEKKKKTASSVRITHCIYTHNVSYEKKLLFEHNLLIETRAKDFSISGRSIIFFFFIFEMEKRDRERIEIVYTRVQVETT